MPLLEEKIHELFISCSSNGATDFKTIGKVFWMCLNNSVSIVDLAGVFTVSIPGNGLEMLNADLFTEFVKALARLRFPTNPDFLNLFINEVKGSKGLRLNTDNSFFTSIMDKNVIRTFLKYDLPLRRAYSNFCGQSVRVSGVLNWEEVKNLSIGMEIDGFIAFAGSCSLVPEHVSTQQCEIMFRDVLTKYPLIANASSQQSDILFPQFQLLLIMAAIEKNENLSKKEKKSDSVYAKKEVDIRNRPITDSLLELFKEIGISRIADNNINTTNKHLNANNITDNKHSHTNRVSAFNTSNNNSSSNDGGGGGGVTSTILRSSGRRDLEGEPNLFTGSVIAPNSLKPENLHTSSLNHSRQAMMLRMEHLFDEVETRVLELTSPDSEVLALLSSPKDDILDSKVRLQSKPVVIADALPVPAQCPDSVEQLLEASLAHHNLGSFEESLKFLEAARVQLKDIHQRFTEYEKVRGQQNSESKLMFIDLEMYITLCKGNVYQSCGDDEQSLLNYMDGWAIAKNNGDNDWVIICLNFIGMLAYYNLRYDVSILCFHAVVNFRHSAYGEESADTATAHNNEACCLFCLDKRGEARLRFEKAWNIISKCLGHRSPRAITAWKNLEKARRAHAPIKNREDLKESMSMRPDADRLLMGGTFIIQALPPPEGGKKKKKKGGGGKKKKK